MRRYLALAMLVAVTSCSGSGSANSGGEEVRAAELLHGLVDKLATKDTVVTMAGTTPGTFEAKSAAVYTYKISKTGKCTYQSDVSWTTSEGKDIEVIFDTDLNSLNPDVYLSDNNLSPERKQVRLLSGAKIACKEPKSNYMCRSFQGVAVMAVQDIKAAQFKDLATKFKQDFCQ
ncbi:hypothetical protein [Mesorhizobium sp. GbtcB19]|uniref:hypothetical protein n=1 Tax=Mesorhizobium sp. GbtcB19 TaxID=2824764 RepID=UPI001C2FC7EC|nr:hypothetical protein [Mesorhizobium sp. GbtcB19]